MIISIKNRIKYFFKLLPESFQKIIKEKYVAVNEYFFVNYYNKSYSQCGEDMIVRFYLPMKKGLYVDVGAYHPVQISNTYYFYKKGWHGINIDGTSSSIKQFKKQRPNDKNVHCCVGVKDGEEVVFYKFKSGALNTFKKEKLADIYLYHNEVPVSEEKVKVRSLASILNEHLKATDEIDLLTVDAEGADEEVLLSNDWKRYRPRVVVVENHNSVDDFVKSGIYHLMSENGYIFGGFSRHSFVFCRKDIL